MRFLPSGGFRGGARGARPPPLILDQTEARRAKKNLFLRLPPPPPPLSEGLVLFFFVISLFHVNLLICSFLFPDEFCERVRKINEKMCGFSDIASCGTCLTGSFVV